MKTFLLIFNFLIFSYPIFSQNAVTILSSGKEQIFNGQFNLIGNSMNGYLAIKHKADHVLHVALTSPMGSNLLEMRWKNGKWKKIHAIKKLGNRKIFGMLAEDILLLFAHYQYEKSFENNGNQWFWNKKRLLTTWHDKKLVSVKIIPIRQKQTSKTINYDFDENGLKKMSINHQGFPFSMTLSPIRKK